MFNKKNTTMKKTIIMAALAVLTTTASAQDDLVKQADKLAKSGEVAEAINVITPALTSEQTSDKAKAWNVLCTIHYNKYLALYTKQQEELLKQATPTVDEGDMHKSLTAAIEAAIKCDEYDCQPNEKGKIKLNYRSDNAKRFENLRVGLINAGQYAYNLKDYTTAIKVWKLYVDSPKATLFTDIDMTKDPYLYDICYYVGLASYQQKDYATAIEYANMAAKDTSKIKDAKEIILFARKDGAKTEADSLEYLQIVKQFHKEEPSEQRYFNLLMEYYTRMGDTNAMLEWVNEEITITPDNKMAWALKGEAEMHTSKLDDAIASYKKALEIDPEFVQVIFNTGVCLNSKAIELKDQLADKNTGGLTKANADKVKAILEDAKVYLLKTREMDPNREKVNWVYPLYQIYYSLGDKANSAEMEKMMENN